MFFASVLSSPAFGKHHTGYTTDPEQRISVHDQFSKTGWKARFGPWIILNTESCPVKNEAMQREKQPKTGRGRLFIKNMIT